MLCKILDVSNLTYTVQRDSADLANILLAGEMVIASDLSGLEADIRNLHKDGVKKIMFDCKDLEYMNSSGLAFLVKTKRKGICVVVRNTTAMLRGVMAISRVDTIITVE